MAWADKDTRHKSIPYQIFHDWLCTGKLCQKMYCKYEDIWSHAWMVLTIAEFVILKTDEMWK